MNEMRKLMEAINQINEAVIEPTEKHETSLKGMKELIENFEWRLDGMAYQLKIQGHEASAASVLNIEGSLHEIKGLFDAALSDLGNKYDRPGGWPDKFGEGISNIAEEEADDIRYDPQPGDDEPLEYDDTPGATKYTRQYGSVVVKVDGGEVLLTHGHGENIFLSMKELKEFVDEIQDIFV